MPSQVTATLVSTIERLDLLIVFLFYSGLSILLWNYSIDRLYNARKEEVRLAEEVEHCAEKELNTREVEIRTMTNVTHQIDLRVDDVAGMIATPEGEQALLEVHLARDDAYEMHEKMYKPLWKTQRELVAARTRKCNAEDALRQMQRWKDIKVSVLGLPLI